MKFLLYFLLLSTAGCTASKDATLNKRTAVAGVLSEVLQQKQAQGIDFFAKGAQPASWTLDIDFDKILRFQSLDGTDYKSTPVQPVVDELNKTSTYTTKAGKRNIVVILINESCTDGISGEKFSKKIRVEVDGRSYTGCGQYLYDNKLDGKWIVEKIDQQIVSAKDFAKGLPELSFNLNSGTLSGNDGCNSITGSIEVMGNRIKFIGQY
ncbi:MAG: META domain-containing protein [Chitinophagaceae bacterium]|nr:MAG: META domain-containing protein [Chitinophagaceae bacterium]